jgi:hypothetical protein
MSDWTPRSIRRLAFAPVEEIREWFVFLSLTSNVTVFHPKSLDITESLWPSLELKKQVLNFPQWIISKISNLSRFWSNWDDASAKSHLNSQLESSLTQRCLAERSNYKVGSVCKGFSCLAQRFTAQVICYLWSTLRFFRCILTKTPKFDQFWCSLRLSKLDPEPPKSPTWLTPHKCSVAAEYISL